MTNSLLQIPVLCVMLLLLGSCELINPEEPVPAYIHIPSVSLDAEPATFGSNSSKITDAWVFVEDKPLGLYQIPATIPVLSSGESRIVVSAGILENGISTTRKIYPFYASFVLNDAQKTVTLEAAKVDTIRPHFEYNSSSVLGIHEDFEGIGIDMERIDGDANIEKITLSQGAFESNSGKIRLTQQKDTYEAKTSDAFDAPEKGTDVYVELDYKCDIVFHMGIMGTTSAGTEIKFFKVGINPRDEWNKIYINFTDDIVNLNARTYQVLIRAEKPDSVTAAEIFVDNLKALTF